MAKKRNFRTNNEAMVEYFTDHPEEIDMYLKGIFEDYAEDPNNAVLLSQLRTVARVKGISEIAAEIGISRQGLQKALSDKGNPRLENINAIVKAMGYQITVQQRAS